MLAILCAAVALAPQSVPDSIRAICGGSGGVARTETIGQSRGGRPIEVVTLSVGDDELHRRPAILVVAGADGRRPIDSELALDQCRRLVADSADADSAAGKLLRECVVHVVPLLNPDGAALGRHGNSVALDIDRDGSNDEDTADDLNGDGMITHMRWPAVDGEWLIDADEPRLMRKADRDEGERGTHHLAIEARDADGDEQRAEDDAHGIWIDRTFPHRWDEFDRRTGPYPMSEPATKALADFVYANRNIVIAFVWGRDDTLLEKPKTAKPKARVQNDGIIEADEKLYERAGELYREKTSREGGGRARMDGSPWAWLYCQVGVPTFASDVWRPTKLEEEDKKDELLDNKRRLAATEAAGRGFVAWTAIEHPDLNDVEIGGFVVEDETALLPAGSRADLFTNHHEFFVEACALRPRVRISSFAAKALAGGAYRLEATVVNDGEVAALTGTGDRSRRFSVPRLILAIGDAELVVGRDRNRVSNLDAHGGHQEFSWIVSGNPGNKIVLELATDPVGSDRKEVTL